MALPRGRRLHEDPDARQLRDPVGPVGIRGLRPHLPVLESIVPRRSASRGSYTFRIPTLTDAPASPRLDNGLLMHALEARPAPVVSLWVWYQVGGRNEVPGTTGMSHFLEHMLFKGTPAHPKGDLDKLLARYGALWNAFTSEDVTCYFETVPKERYPVALELEADRMRNALISPEETEAERTVIVSVRERSARARALDARRGARWCDRGRRGGGIGPFVATLPSARRHGTRDGGGCVLPAHEGPVPLRRRGAPTFGRDARAGRARDRRRARPHRARTTLRP